MNLNLEIISPQKVIFNEEIDLCILPGAEGDFGILKKHMPFLTTLRLGIAYIYKNKKLHETFLINGGDDYKISDKNLESDKQKSLTVKKLFYS